MTKLFADKVVDDDVLLPGDHVDLLILASPHPAVSVQPGKQLHATFTKDLKRLEVPLILSRPVFKIFLGDGIVVGHTKVFQPGSIHTVGSLCNSVFNFFCCVFSDQCSPQWSSSPCSPGCLSRLPPVCSSWQEARTNQIHIK